MPLIQSGISLPQSLSAMRREGHAAQEKHEQFTQDIHFYIKTSALYEETACHLRRICHHLMRQTHTHAHTVRTQYHRNQRLFFEIAHVT